MKQIIMASILLLSINGVYALEEENVELYQTTVNEEVTTISLDDENINEEETIKTVSEDLKRETQIEKDKLYQTRTEKENDNTIIIGLIIVIIAALVAIFKFRK